MTSGENYIRTARFGKPERTRHCVETLCRPEGGLMLKYGLYPETPIQNAFAIADAMEKYSSHYS
jgi:hypothetical protein